jgi:TonB family protein
MRSLTASALLLLLLGCGGGAPPLQPDTAHDARAAPESFPEVNPADLAELDAGLAPSKPETAPPASTGAISSTPEPKDDCTPVGIDFEKRARPKMKECYAAAKKKEPDLKGTVRITIDVDTLGKVKSYKIVEKTLPEAVAQCMLKVVKATPLPEASKCPGKSITIPITFPTPH